MTQVTASRIPRQIARADVVGRLLPSPRINTQHRDLSEGQTAALRSLVLQDRTRTIAALERLANETLADPVQHQIDAGLDRVSGGEVRFHQLSVQREGCADE